MTAPDARASEVCVVCGAAGQADLPPYAGHAMRRCPECSLVYTFQRDFSTAQYEDVYASQGAYRGMVRDAERTAAGEQGYRDLWWFKRMALRWLERLAPRGALVDIGSGPGTFLMVARQRGWRVQGVEPARVAAELARRLGVETFNGTVQEFRAQGGVDDSFEAATCFEVLEHVPDIHGHLEATRHLLKPGGVLVLSVPNLDDPYCLQQMIPSNIPPVHINFFNRRSLGTALRRAGLETIRSRTLPIPTSSVRNIHGRRGLLLRLPWLALRSLVGRADGTTLVVAVRRVG